MRLSPDRDLSLMFHPYMLAALKVAPGLPGLTPEAATQLEQLTARLIEFVKGCRGPERPKSVHDLAERLGLPDPALADGERALGAALLRVLLGAYFKAVGDAFTPQDRVFPLQEMLEAAGTGITRPPEGTAP